MLLSSNPDQPRKHRKLRLVIWGLLLIILGLFLTSKFSRSDTIISPLPDEPSEPAKIFSLFTHKKDPDELRSLVKDTVGNTLVNYSVYVKDFTQDFHMEINESVIYIAASVNKLPVLAALYYYVQKGEIDLDRNITIQKEDVQDYGTGSIRYDPVGSVYSVKTLAQLMIQKSDNTAAYLLSNQVIGVNKIQSLINSWGLTQTDIINNKTSNKDMEIILEKIYTGGVANLALTQEMLSLLSDSDFEDRLPALLPSDAKVYHKIGTEVNTIHDVGIVEHGKIKYYIGVFSTNVTSEEAAQKKIAEISKKVYDYMQ